jgi:hypothetical protein
LYLSKTEANSTYVSNVNINITLNNILNNSITVNSDINNIKSALPSLLLINNFNNTINSYLQINQFNNTINSYLQINQFNNTISSYMQINQFNNTLNSYMQINQFNNTISSYLKTSDFNLTKSSLVDTVANQTISGNKSFNNLVKFKGSDNIIGGEPSIQIMPKEGTSGQAFLEFHKYADGTMPVFGDRWLMGSDMESLNYLPRRSFSIWASSLNFRSVHLYITPTGQTVIPFGSFSCPTIHTNTINSNTLNINNTNINELYQSKTDMSNYLKISDFNITKSSLIDTISSQDINSVKRFFQNIIVKSGSGSIKIYPQDFQIGEASIQYFRYADNATLKTVILG